MNNDGYRSRKFWLTVAVLAVSAVALFTDDLGGREWVAVVTLVSAVFSTANVMEKRQ